MLRKCVRKRNTGLPVQVDGFISVCVAMILSETQICCYITKRGYNSAFKTKDRSTRNDPVPDEQPCPYSRMMMVPAASVVSLHVPLMSTSCLGARLPLSTNSPPDSVDR